MTNEEAAKFINTMEKMMNDIVIPAVLAEVRLELENIVEQYIVYHVAKLHYSSDRVVLR